MKFFIKKLLGYFKPNKTRRPAPHTWKGFSFEEFTFEGYTAIIVLPKKANSNNSWVWRTEFFGAFPNADIAMLKNGYHLVHLAIPNQFGSPASIARMQRFQALITKKFNLNKKTILFGFSRGGLYAIHYAANFPENVSALYLDAPVVDLKSWPFGCCRSCGSKIDCGLSLGAFEIDSVEKYAPILTATLTKLSLAKVPIVMVSGDSDTVVPYDENGLILENLYRKNNIPFSLTLKKGGDHHPHGLPDPTSIVEFLIANDK